jgi:hypothetical protein
MVMSLLNIGVLRKNLPKLAAELGSAIEKGAIVAYWGGSAYRWITENARQKPAPERRIQDE